jgi:hypothetical protein
MCNVRIALVPRLHVSGSAGESSISVRDALSSRERASNRPYLIFAPRRLLMTTAVQHLLDSLQNLSDAEQHELLVEILRRAVDSHLPPLSDDDLVLNAETLFLEMDRLEASNERN